jgi:hypothetical protein
MTRVAIVLLFACGGKPAPEPVNNVAPASQVAPEAGGAAKVVQRTGQGGVFELSGDREAAMKQALDEMRAHCGPNAFTIVQEGEEAVRNENGTGSRTTAWRVHYQCNE